MPKYRVILKWLNFLLPTCNRVLLDSTISFRDWQGCLCTHVNRLKNVWHKLVLKWCLSWQCVSLHSLMQSDTPNLSNWFSRSLLKLVLCSFVALFQDGFVFITLVQSHAFNILNSAMLCNCHFLVKSALIE